MTGGAPGRRNPYVGPRAFTTGEMLYGRGRELKSLLNLLIAERIVLLYSPSGAGKTSLIQAALIPSLEKERFRVLPVMRVGLDPPPEIAQAVPDLNRHLFSLLLSLEKGRPPGQQTALDQLATMNLATYLAQWRDPGTEVVLIFDQFEEILTGDPMNRPAKEAFFDQVGEALRDEHCWALFALREDYLAPLDPYRPRIPTRLTTTFRLDLLGEGAARQAIQLPAQAEGVTFTDEAATRLVNDLRTVRIQRADGGSEPQLGPYVEPVQLQVVCRRLWEKLPPTATQIGEADVAAAGAGSVDRALGAYYADQVAVIAGQTRVQERAIREWIDQQLITRQGLRGQVQQEPEQSQGLDNDAVWALRDAYLVRAENRRGTIWFELAHDRLIAPIQADNTAWLDTHLSLLQRQATLWDSRGQPESLLLRDRALRDAVRWAAAHPAELTARDRAFLEECQKAQRQQQNTRLIRVGGVAFLVLALFSIVVVGLFVDARTQERVANEQKVIAVAEGQRANEQARLAQEQQGTAVAERNRADELAQIAQEQRRLATARQLAAQAVTHLGDQPDLALLLGVAGAQITDTLETGSVLLTGLQQYPYFAAFLWGQPLPANSVVFSPDGTRVAAGGCGRMGDVRNCLQGEIHLWDTATRQPVGPPLRGHTAAVTRLAFAPHAPILASASDDETIILWDLTTFQPQTTLRVPDHAISLFNNVYSLAFSPDGTRLAAGTRFGSIQVWDVTGPPRPLADLTAEADDAAWSLAFSPDSATLAAGYENATILLWDVASQRVLDPPLTGHTQRVRSVAFSPDGKTLASGSRDTTVILWDTATHQPISSTLTGHTDSVTSVAFSPDDKTLLSSSADGTLRLWDVATHQPYSVPLTGHAGAVISTAFSQDGTTLASSGVDNTIRLWDITTRRSLSQPLSGHPGWTTALAFAGGQTLVATTADGLVLWDTATRQPIAGPLPDNGQVPSTLALSPDGTLLAAGGTDQIRLWDVATRQLRDPPLTTPAGRIAAVAFSPDGTLLAAGGCGASAEACNQGWVRLWRVATGQPVGEPLPGTQWPVTSLAFSPDGRKLVAGTCQGPGGVNCRGGQVVVWEVTPPPVPEPTRIATAFVVRSLAFSPDRRLLALGTCESLTVSGTSCAAGGVRLWDAGTFQPADTPFLSQQSEVTGVAFSPNGQTLAAADAGGITLWDAGLRLKIGDLLPGQANAVPPPLPFPGAETAVKSIAFSPDGTRLATGQAAGSILLWETSPASWWAAACAMANRNLTPAEWLQYLGQELYRPLCPDLPSGATPPTPTPTP